MSYARLDRDPHRAVTEALGGRSEGIIVPTSGSTGTARDVLVSAAAIRASAALTAARLAGHSDPTATASWLLALPPTRIGGAMVIARAILAGTALVTMPAGPFTAAAFASAAAAMPRSGPRHVSLVPTQLRRLLSDPEGRDALATFDTVLVGGAALAVPDAPANVVTTYGMSETTGGCVYDGVPLDGVGVRVDADGRIWLSGPTLALGYADGDASDFRERDGTRWFVTSDLGELSGGRLRVLGRADHVINTGGVKVHPQRVELAIERAGAAAVAVVGVPDPEWGERVVAVVEGDIDADALAAALDTLERYERPRSIVRVARLPRTPGGKMDRPAARRLAQQEDR
ncbi:MAG: AMP-binding protein [Actinomycetes bacterium]